MNSSFISKYKPYSSYKNSGIDWLGDIPQHWDVTRLNFIAKKIGDGIHATPKYVDSSNYYFINGNNLINGTIVINNLTKCVADEEFNKYNLRLNKNTLLLSINGTIGNIAYYNDELVILGKSAAYIILKPNINKNFIYYFLRSQVIKNYFLCEITGTTILNLSLKSIRNTFIVSPSFSEQKAIASYLDSQTTKIDTLIAKKERFIKLLQEKRTALISHTVTKGLNPNVPMKDSGIEWLGDIPQHWEVTRMANFGIFSKGKGINKTQLSDEGLPALLYGDIYTKYEIKTDFLKRKIPQSIATNSVEIFCNDLLLTGSGETSEDIGKCLLYTGKNIGYAGGDVIIFRQNKNFSLYLSYLFNSYFFRQKKGQLSKGEIIVHVYASQLRDIHFALPPLPEQKEIAFYLDNQTAKIDKLIDKTKESIEKLKEYRTGLISAVVTGKIDIREWVEAEKK